MARVEAIQVSGFRKFSGERWREAFLHYLFGIWSGDMYVTYRPKICLDRLSIWRNDGENMDGKYFVHGHRPVNYFPRPQVPTESKMVVSETTFEHGLIRFVKNDRILELELQLPQQDVTVWLWKNPNERSFLGIMVSGSACGSSFIDFPPDEKTA